MGGAYGAFGDLGDAIAGNVLGSAAGVSRIPIGPACCGSNTGLARPVPGIARQAQRTVAT